MSFKTAPMYILVQLANRDRSHDASDNLIAAHAMALGVTLVTNNQADFAIYPGLVMENWFSQH